MSNALKELVENDDVFADVMNMLMFNGKQVIDPDDLYEVDEATWENVAEEDRPNEDMICRFWKKRGIILRLGGFDEALEMMQDAVAKWSKEKK